MPYASEKRRALTAIFIVFLFIFSEVLVAENENQTELETQSASYSLYSYSTNSVVHISSQFPDTNFASSSESLVGLDAVGDEHRTLYRFSNNLTKSSDLILNAELRLTCQVIYQQSSGYLPTIFAATALGNFAPNEVTWNEIADSIPWQVSGADGPFDRGEWELPSESTNLSPSVHEYLINVTKLVQTTLELSRNKFDIIVSSLGGSLSCAKSNNVTTSYHPELIITQSQGTHGSGGSVEQNFVLDGAPLMSNDFIMTADIDPIIRYTNLVGSGVDFQFSLSNDFRNVLDLNWSYSTTSNQFTTIGLDGFFDIPNSEAFPTGSTIHYRIRSIDSTSKLSDWSNGYFLLPDYNVTNNNDGTATIMLGQSDLNLLNYRLIEDTYIDSSNIQSHGSDQFLFVSNSANSNQVSLLKVNLNLLGIHSNATILSANLDLTRQTVTSTGPILSLHPIDHSLWSDSEATWNYGKVGQTWSNGGLNHIGASEESNINSNTASDSFSFNIQNSLQSNLENSSLTPLSFMLTGVGVQGQPNPTLTEEIKFAATEYQGAVDLGPKVNITYSWTSNQSIPDVLMNYPINSQPVWEITNNNLSGDLTPTLEWNSSDGNFRNYILQVSNDPIFRDVILQVDSRGQNLPSITALQNYTFSSSNQLSEGSIYHWRIKQSDGDGRLGAWNYSSFFISSLESEWIGGDNFKFTINNSLDPSISSIPGFKFSSISSVDPNTNSYGYPYMYVADSSSGKYNSLLGLNSRSYVLPTGYAVISSNLSMTTQSSSSNQVNIGVWEMSSDDWDEQEVTWIESSNGVPWNSPGASGSQDRKNMLSNSTVSSNCCTIWNVTSAVQNSMRDGNNLNFMFEIMPDSFGSNALFHSPQNPNSALQPQLEIIFTIGSSQKPNPPTAVSPTIEEWVYKNNSTLESEPNIEFVWNHTNPMPIVGWAFEIDSSITFDTIDKRSFSSWNDIGFDVLMCEYELQTPLDIGKKWFWRVRGLSNTYQLGDWSQGFTFYLPNLNYNDLGNGIFTTEYSQSSIFSNEIHPSFVDLQISDDNDTDFDNKLTNSILSVGKDYAGYDNSILISVPLPLGMQPENASLVSANFALEATTASQSGITLALREVLQPWDSTANGLNYNSTNSWNNLGGRSIGQDISAPLDLQQSQPGEIIWNITQLVQGALADGRTMLSLMVYTSNVNLGEQVFFYSSDSSNSKPELNFSWVVGQRDIPLDQPVTSSPIGGQLFFNQTSHAVLPESRPTYTWSMTQNSLSVPDEWRVFIQLDSNDDMSGNMIFDSRESPELFDLNVPSFTPDVDINFDNQISWFVQPIQNDMLGTSSNVSSYLIPNIVSQEINQTDASITIQDGSIYPATNYPMATQDIFLDEGNPYQSNNSVGLMIGNSTLGNSNLTSTTAILSFDLSTIPFPTTMEIIDAQLQLTSINGNGSAYISASRMLTDWDENSTWDNSSNGQSWINGGALRGQDSELPDSLVYVDGIGVYTWNVTRILQLTLESNLDSASVLLQPEIFYSPSGVVDGNFIFADSENSNISLRPKLQIEYRVSPTWLPPSTFQSSPSNSATLWNESSPALEGASHVEFELMPQISNFTTANLCYGNEIRWLKCISSEISQEGYNWNPATNTFNLSNSSEIFAMKGDEWQYWRVRVDQDHRIGHYSPVFNYRIPSNQSTTDGEDNYTVEFYRGSVFEQSGLMPIVSDSDVNSLLNQNNGDSSTISLGTNPATGGVQDAYFQYNLSDIFFAPTTTPTSMIFELNMVAGQASQGPISVAVYACDSFDETTISSVNLPTCSTNEATRTTITGGTGSVATWDLTSLGQNNFFTQNRTISFKLQIVSGLNNYIQFHSSETSSGIKPIINLTFIENLDGYLPPSQVNLVAPADGEILYDVNGGLVTSVSSVDLDWSLLPDATSYKLFISNSSGVYIFDSLIDSEIIGNQFTSNMFSSGSSYQWWVQAYNQSIPGPPSPRWSFGLGDPVQQDNQDGTYTYTLSDSSEILDFNHMEVIDTAITDAAPDSNFGTSTTMDIGGGCQNIVNSICDVIVSFDSSQLPLDSNVRNLHSLSLELSVEQWDLTGGAYQVEFSIHKFLYTNWDEMTLTWNNTGVTPGPQPGIDFVSQPIDVKLYSQGDNKLSFDVGETGQSIGGVYTFLIRGTPISTGGNFDGFVSIYSSESADYRLRPKWDVIHTDVSTLNISSQSNVFDADGTYTFDVQSFDSGGVLINGGIPVGAEIEWATTTGSLINSVQTTAVLSPTVSGVQVISACYGIICTDYTILIDAGIPVEIFASFNQTSDKNDAVINADQSINAYAYAIDQFGNIVTNEIIAFSSSNGSISPSGLFLPYSTGIHTITAEWIGTANSLQEDLQIEVTPGVPVSVSLSGCSEVIAADTSCQILGTAYDQFDNLVWFSDVGAYTLSVSDGEITQISTPTPPSNPPSTDILIGEFTGNLVGQWQISFTSELGIASNILVDVDHGEFASLELTGSAATISSDDILYLNSTRIDVRGNRLALDLPLENWTSVADGQLITGFTASWYPTMQGTKSITASYEGLTDTFEVFVTRGKLDRLEIIINDEVSNDEIFSVTADEQITAEVVALDANGNQWIVDGNWSFFHPDFANNAVLSSNFGREVTFSPTMASTTPYIIYVEYYELDITISQSFAVFVSVGDIENFLINSTDSQGFGYSTSDGFDITSDDFIQFSIYMTDADLNQITDISPTWTLQNYENGGIVDMSDSMSQNGLIWHATEVGEFQISAYLINQRGFNLTAEFDIMVSHGMPVSLTLQQSVTTQDAGNFVDLQVTGTDSDGNQFPQAVVWLENNGPSYNINLTDDEGIYQFNGRSAGNYTLTAEYLTLSNSVYVEVFPLGIVKNIKSNISAVELEQLEVITVQIDAYDLYWNKIPVPNSARIDTTDRGDVKYLGGGVWELSTLDEGEHSATIVIGSITETFTYNVEGNLAGFFAAGGPLYYVGAGLIGLIVIALLVFVIRLVRGDEDYYDDDEDDDDYYQDSSEAPVTKDFSQPRISQAPTVPTPPAQPPTSEPEPEPEVEESIENEEEDTSWMADYRVDEDGTEWGQTEDGVWYYRDSGSDEWIEWTD